VIFLALFLLTRSGVAAAWQILALAFAAGAVTVFADTALAIAVRDVFTGPRVLSANSWLSVASSAVVAATANALYTWAIIVASVTMRSLRQVLVPRELLGRVTASWRLGGQGVTLGGALLAGAITAALSGDPRPVFAAAGCLTIGTVAAAWWTGLHAEELPAGLTPAMRTPAAALTLARAAPESGDQAAPDSVRRRVRRRGR